MMKQFFGTGVALVTPFNQSGQVDYPSLKKLIKHTAKSVDYFVVMGTTGEAPTVTPGEKTEIIKFIRQQNTKKLPIVYGIGGNNTQGILDTIKGTDFEGIDGILSTSPYYNKPSQEGIYQHFKAISAKSPVPIILYNIPGRTGSNMSAETTLRLAKLKNIVAIKEASGNMNQCMQIAKDKPDDFALISGDDTFAFPIYCCGGTGVISVLANAFPQTFKKMKDYFLAGKLEKAREEQFKLLEINPYMYEEGNPTGIKQVLALMGVISTKTCRLPMADASAQLKKLIGTHLRGLS